MKHANVLVAGAVLVAAGSAVWLLRMPEPGPAPAAQGMVTVAPARPAATPASLAARGDAVAIGALPAQVTAHVRQAYPLLTDVAFRCDAAGCAVTATIPPPTDDAFLAKRQEMLLGGLAKAVEAMGYTPLGPVQMDEVAENLFHLRLAVTQARPRG
jgi:hypothetical protein